MFRSELAALIVLGALASPGSARGETPSDDATSKARTEFIAATDHVRAARWGEALAAFERSAAYRPHALTTFNIGACERALGRYVHARATLQKALAANEASNRRELAASFANDAKRWIEDIDRVVVRATISVKPPDATILVDGAPSDEVKNGRGSLLLDPGSHVFSLSRAGFASAVVTKTFAAGTTPNVELDLQSLPATLRIAADRAGSVVGVDELDVGVAPVQLSRPAGTYVITVRKPGFLTYRSSVKVGPGEEPTIRASLPPETTPVTQKAWFWVLAVGVVAGAAVGTYFLTQPEPERPAPNGGGLNWVVTVTRP